MSWVLTKGTTLFQTKRFAKQGKQRVEPSTQQDAHKFHHRSKGHLLTLLLTSDYALPWPFCHLRVHLIQVNIYNDSLMLCLLLELIRFEDECVQPHHMLFMVCAHLINVGDDIKSIMLHG